MPICAGVVEPRSEEYGRTCPGWTILTGHRRWSGLLCWTDRCRPLHRELRTRDNRSDEESPPKPWGRARGLGPQHEERRKNECLHGRPDRVFANERGIFEALFGTLSCSDHGSSSRSPKGSESRNRRRGSPLTLPGSPQLPLGAVPPLAGLLPSFPVGENASLFAQSLLHLREGHDADHPCDPESELPEDAGLRRPGLRYPDRDSGIRLLSDRHHQRNLS